MSQPTAIPDAPELPPAESPGVAPALGKTVKGGVVWMVANTVFAKGAGFVAQVILAALLSQEDFGVYAIALGASMITTLLRDGGVRQLLIQRSNDYDELEGPVFWLALACNFVTALILAGLAPLLGYFYGEPRIVPLLLIISLSMPISTPGAILSARLTIELRFGALSMTQLFASLLRYASMIILALVLVKSGHGALAFVLPTVLNAVYDGVVYYPLTKRKPWLRPAKFRTWPSMLGLTMWVLIGFFAVGMVNNGLSLVLGKFLDLDSVGVYFFATSLVMQLGVLIAYNLFQILFPALAKLSAETERRRAAIERSLRILTVISAPFCASLIPVIDPLEKLLWNGKWHAAVLPTQILSAFYPMYILISIPMAAQQAAGHFRSWGLWMLALAAGTLISGGAGAMIHHDASGVALWSGVYMFISCLLYTIVALKPLDVGPVGVLRDTLPPWAISVIAAAPAIMVDRWFLADTNDLIRVIVAAVVYGVSFAVGARVVTPGLLRETISLAPARLRPLASRCLLLER